MAYTSPATPVALTAITVAFYNTNIRDNIVYFRGLLPSPAAANKLHLSTAADSADWLAPGTEGYPLRISGGVPAYAQLTNAGMAAGAAVANIGYTPFSKAGDTITKNTGAVDANLYQRAGVILNTSDGSRPAIAFSRDGTGAAALYWESGTSLRMVNNSGVSAIFWSDANDGAGSGLDADLLDAQSGAFYLARGNHTGTQLAATISDLATAVSGMAAASATNATNVTTTINGTAIASFARLDVNNLGSESFNLGSGTTLRFGNTGDGWAVRLSGGVASMRVDGDFTATGTKSRSAAGHDGNEGLFHAFETPLPLFAEPGRGRLVDGVAVVEIDPGFANYVDLTDYDVLLTARGPSHLYIDPDEMTPESFTVRALDGEPDVSFSAFILARQGDMTHIERVLPLGREGS